MVAACALILCNSQGGLFNQIGNTIIGSYERVGVALSRQTILENLVLINATIHLVFYHTQDKYLRLAYRHLPTVTMDIKQLFDAATADKGSFRPGIL